MDFERLANRHRDSVYRQMVRVCGNQDDAEDALAGALLAAFRYSKQLRDDSAFPGWLSMIGRRVCGHMRRQKAVQEVMVGLDFDRVYDTTPDAQAQVEKQELAECVHAAIQELSPLYRQAYVRCEVDGDPCRAVAKELGISEPALKARLHRARAKVRQSLDIAVGC